MFLKKKGKMIQEEHDNLIKWFIIIGVIILTFIYIGMIIGELK
jgi:hypothetical protein